MSDTTETLLLMMALYGAFWVANSLIGIYNSLNKGFKFSWKYFGAGTVKAAVGAVALVIGAVALQALPTIFTGAGVTVDPATASAMSVVGVIGVVGAGVVTYAKKFVTGVKTLFESSNSVKLETRVDPENPNKGTVVLDVQDLAEPAGPRENVEDEPRDEEVS